MKTQQDKHNQLIDDLHEEAIDSLNDAIENFEKIIVKCNHAYYVSTEIESRLTDAEYDDICQQYVALNKIIGNDIELASCRFLR